MGILQSDRILHIIYMNDFKREKRYCQLLTQLKIISLIKENDKIRIDGDEIRIDSPSPVQGMWRYWNGETRYRSMGKLREMIDNVITAIREVLIVGRHQLQSAHANPHNHDEKHNNDSRDENKLSDGSNGRIKQCDFDCAEAARFTRRAIRSLQSSREGLKNLSKTYNTDSQITAIIDAMIDEIDDFNDFVSRHVQ